MVVLLLAELREKVALPDLLALLLVWVGVGTVATAFQPF